MKYLMAMLLLATIGRAAITDWYVTDSGVGTGATIVAPMSLATFHDHMGAAGAVNAVPGARYNIKAGSYASRTTTIDTWANSGTATNPIIIRGYGTTPGDGYLGRDSSGALVTTSMPLLSYSTGGLTINNGFFILESIQLTSGRSGAAFNASGGSAIDYAVVRCAITNSSTNVASAGVILTARAVLFDCDITMSGASGSTASAVNALTASNVVDSCRIRVTPSTCAGIIAGSSAAIYANTIIGTGGVGIDMTVISGAPFIRSNTIVGCSDGINIITGTTTLQRMIGNMITDNSAIGIDMVVPGNAGFLAYNRLRDNVSGSINSGTDWVAATSYGQATLDTGTTGDSATDYVNFAGANLNLISASPATSAGVPPKASIGALQRDQTGATASTSYSATFAQ